MKKLILTIALTLPLLIPGSALAQNYTQDIQQKDYQRNFYNNYSRWSIGVDAGISAVWGDLRSFSDDKTYIGGLFGINAAYQFTPTVGLRFSASYGFDKAGATSKNKDFLIAPDGFTYNGPDPAPANAILYSQIYSKIKLLQFGLNTEININNLLAGNRNIGNRRWTFLVNPGVYLQYFKPALYFKDGGQKFNSSALHYDWNFGLGGDAAIRFKASKVIDLQLKGGAIWVLNKKFDGISSATNRELNGTSFVQAGIIFKIGARRHNDHLLYASTGRYVRKVFATEVREVLRIEEKIVEKPVERIVTVEVGVQEMPKMPAVYFERGSAVIDQTKYALELREIITTLKKFPNEKVEIWGYADHTGGTEVNDKITLGRAEALRDYLISQGIDRSRIVNIRAMGKDPQLEGEAAFSVVARRAVVVE